MFMDQVDLMDLMDNVGAPRDNPRVGSAAVGWDAGGRFTAGVCFACLIATAVCGLRGRDACVGPVGPVGPVGQVGASRDNPWVCGAQFGVARAGICRWVARTVWQRWRAGCGGVALAYGPDGPNGPNGQDGGAKVYPGECVAVVWYGSEARCAVGVIIAIGAPITQSHNSHNSHNSHIKRRPTRHCK